MNTVTFECKRYNFFTKQTKKTAKKFVFLLKI